MGLVGLGESSRLILQFSRNTGNMDVEIIGRAQGIVRRGSVKK